MEPNDPTPLDYHDPRSDERAPDRSVGIGCVAAGIFWLSGGVFLVSVLASVVPSFGVSARQSYIAGFILFLAAIVSVAFIFSATQRRKWFLLGWLLGTAIMGLLEGICFINT